MGTDFGGVERDVVIHFSGVVREGTHFSSVEGGVVGEEGRVVVGGVIGAGVGGGVVAVLGVGVANPLLVPAQELFEELFVCIQIYLLNIYLLSTIFIVLKIF